MPMWLYSAARKCWTVLKWFWMAAFVTLFLSFGANLLVVKVMDYPTTIFAAVLAFIVTPGPGQTIFLLAVAFVLALTVVSRWLLAREKSTGSDDLLHNYLQAVIESNQSLNPSGFAQQSQALISVNVPLNDIFIRLHVVSDRPIYDRASEQEHLKLLDELRQRDNVKSEEREELIRRLQVMWYSQIGQQDKTKVQRRSVVVNDIFEYINPESPVSVLLGTPGSGKSTTLRWLSLHMARAMLSPSYQIPTGEDDNNDDDDDDTYYYHESLRRIPLLLRISDYAKLLVNTPYLSVTQFLTLQISAAYPKLPDLDTRLLDEARKGRCLFLLDGLDEVASDLLRRQVAQNIDAFITEFSRFRADAAHWNMFLVTSRIVGYEAGSFARYAHFTLLDFEDEQIERFLARWCPTVERYQMMFAQGMKPLSSQQEGHAEKEGANHRDVLVHTIFHNSGIKRLAVNPLMLTILALIQRSGKTLPHRRIELYQIVTRTLLDNWNKTSERRVFPVEEVPLAEQLLGNLAYQLHSADPILTEQEVKAIARSTMTDFYGYAGNQIKDSEITQFIEVLRSSSGLFIESGQGLFNFMHRTFQEYFVALHLLRKTPQELKHFVVKQYHSPIWREPLLLAIAYKSGQSGRSEWQEASALICAIKDAKDDYSKVLHHHLLFAASTIVDCSAWSIDAQLQQDIAITLFELYGDEFGSGHYSALKREIAKTALLWLRGQPQDTSHAHALPPLLAAWCHALQDATHPLRRQGAVRLLATLAPYLSSCPASVLKALMPQLLCLAEVTDMPFASAWHPQPAQPGSAVGLQEAYYAWLALSKIAPRGPSEQLKSEWDAWRERKPEANALLTDYLNTLGIGNVDDEIHQLLLIRLLDAEMIDQSKAGYDWKKSWHALLQKEMARGRLATYLPCLNLRLLLVEDDEALQQALREELLKTLSAHDQQALYLLVVLLLSYLDLLELEQNMRGNYLPRRYDEYVDNVYEPGRLANPLPPRRYNPRTISPQSAYPRVRAESSATRFTGDLNPQPRIAARRLRPIIRRASTVPIRVGNPTPFTGPPLMRPSITRKSLFIRKPTLIQRWRRARRVAWRKLKAWREDWPAWIPFSLHKKDIEDDGDTYVDEPDSEVEDFDEAFAVHQQAITQNQSIWRFVLKLPDMPFWLSIWEESWYASTNLNLLHTILKREELVEKLCELIAGPLRTKEAIELLTLHVVLATFEYIPPALQVSVEESIQMYRTSVTTPSLEQSLLLDALVQRLQGPVELLELPDTRADILRKLQKQSQLNKVQVELLLQASIDTRRLVTRLSGKNAVYDLAWDLVKQSFALEAQAQQVVVDELGSAKAMICASAAFLLQNCKSLLPEVRTAATEKILAILADPALARRSLDTPDNYDWQLDDILFETLQSLAGRDG